MSKHIFGTKEWAPQNANCCRGCFHDCKYCYAKAMAVRFRRRMPETWCIEQTYLERVRQVAKMAPTRVMFPTTHDITLAVLPVFLAGAQELLAAGHELLIVSKAHPTCFERMCSEFAEYRSQITYRISIGSVDPETLAFWEPGAPSFQQRFRALRHAFEQGYRTSVSCEPLLDDKAPILVRKLTPFVSDSIWIGKVNMLKSRLATNGHTDSETLSRANQLLRWQSDEQIQTLYETLKNHPLVKWKESIKKVVGLAIEQETGCARKDQAVAELA